MRQIFDATDRTRGVYFFDEFDAIGSERAIANDVGEIRRVLNSFLQMIEQDTTSDPEPLMRKDAEQKTEPIRTIHHTESGHSVDRAELLRSERVRKVISEVADKPKVSRTVESRGTTSKSTS